MNGRMRASIALTRCRRDDDARSGRDNSTRASQRPHLARRTGAVKYNTNTHVCALISTRLLETRRFGFERATCGKSSRFTSVKLACRLATRVGNCIVSNTGFNRSAFCEGAREGDGCAFLSRAGRVVVHRGGAETRLASRAREKSLKIARRFVLTRPTDPSLVDRRCFEKQWTNAER